MKQICTLKGAFENISKAIGENSIYDIYGAELIYQFTPVKDKQNEEKVCYYSGRLQWKIIARNENDDKDTWFYVDVENGEVTHRFKEIYGE